MDIALVHGSYHGAWCWDLVRGPLEAAGHRVIAVDLPISTPGLGAAAYAQVVLDALAGTTEPLVVGHSMGGLVIPLVAARRPVRRLAFLAAFLPRPGESLNDQRAAEPIDGRVPPSVIEFTDLGSDVWMIGPGTARELFYDDVSEGLASWATDRLRPQAYTVTSEVTPLERWPDVPSTAIVCADRPRAEPRVAPGRRSRAARGPRA
jgi:pimeloyl-ACP methyl ester carboxylesterase